MSFVLETKKNGKDTILYNNNKFRESYSVKNGDIVWRCLGKICKACIRTNQEKTIIFSSNEAHSGPHPVTARAFTPTLPLQKRSPRPPTPVVESDPPPLPPASATTCSPAHYHEADPSPSVDLQHTEKSPCTSRLDTLADLQAENLALRKELERLRVDRQTVLNHSIESDQRLLRYTENIFAPPPSRTPNNTDDLFETCSSGSEPREGQTADSYHRNKSLEANDDLDRAHTKIKELEQKIISISRPCETCTILREETRNMIESLRCLEAENAQLKNSVVSRHPTTSTDSSLKPQPMLPLHNRFDVLNEEEHQVTDEDTDFVTVTKKQNKKGNRQNTRSSEKSKGKKSIHKRGKDSTNYFTLPFNNVSIIGDSHVRNLASLMKRQVPEGSKIVGVCKPGAGLLDVKPTSTPPRDHCYVLMAGTNDVDAGKEETIFRHLEDVLLTCKTSSRVLALSLPARHDLDPYSPLHHSVRIVNSYIAELCRRHEGVEMLDIRTLPREHFTTHGLHLKASGKRFLARLILKKLALMKPALNVRPVLTPIAAAPSTSPFPAPSTLPFETFAEAVKTSRPHNCPPDQHPPDVGNSLPSSSKVFLGRPIPAVGKN